MEQQMQQPDPQPVNPAPQPSSGGSSKVWLWIIGGCLGIIIIIGLILGGLAWWGARKIKNEIKNSKPKIEQFSREMEEKAKSLEKINEELEKQAKNAEKSGVGIELPENTSD